MSKRRPTEAEGNAQRDDLLSLALIDGYAARVAKRAVELQMGPAILAMVGTGDDVCDRLRASMLSEGHTTDERMRRLHDQQRRAKMPEHNAVLWAHTMLLELGPVILPPEEMTLVIRRLPDPAWRVIVALGGGGATALCLPADVVMRVGDLGQEAQDLAVAEAAEMGDME